MSIKNIAFSLLLILNTIINCESSQIEQSKQSIPISKQIENYLNSLEVLSVKFTQKSSSDNRSHKGNIWILRGNKSKSQARVVYDSGPISDMLIQGRYVTIIDRRTKKIHKYSILNTPIYAMLIGQLKLSDLNYKILNDTIQYVCIMIQHSNKQVTVITFSKFKKSGNIDKLIAWTIDDGKTAIQVEFDTDQYFANDKSKLPSNIFKM